MSEKPEALRLADLLKTHFWEGKCGRDEWDAAAKELRRQHADNERLRELLSRTESALDVLAQTIRDVEEIVGVELTVKAEAVTELATEVRAALRREETT